MSSRSLTASESGLQRAKTALQRRSMTQKSLANERGIASWSTISKFFNRKPIDRFQFQAICNELDLDWETIVREAEHSNSAMPREVSSSPWLELIQRQAIAAREALTPRILERIPRAIVQEKYLPAIARGTAPDGQRVIPLIGGAGYGKSTILGTLYDELTAANPWVGVILCSSLRLTPGQSLAIAFGEAVSGRSADLLEIVESLNQTQGKGVLLIDTLDLVISRSFVIEFAELLRSLVDHEVTVVFTCRDYEYNDFLEPTREKLAGLAERVDRHTVPGFTPTEIRTAALSFFQKLSRTSVDRGISFAEKILTLSADNRSLQAITQNPLLLALLCDLFAQDGFVPPDLTVSKLYQRYWNDKVVYDRTGDTHTSPLAFAKEDFCIAIARSLFQLSTDKLCESAYRDELDIVFSSNAIAAYDDLLSEGVLDRLPSQKIHFFHQTLLEYAIAYWLTRRSAQDFRQQLFQRLQQPEVSTSHTYWLPILRQYLAIVESETEFEAIVTELNLQDMGIFGAAAFAAVSRQQSIALQYLLPTALKLGEAHQKRLQQALESAPRQFVEDSWDILLTLLSQADHVVAANTSKMVSLLLTRWWTDLRRFFPQTLNAIALRTPAMNRTVHIGKDDRSYLFGWLLQPCMPLIQEDPQPELLAALRSHYFILGYRSCAATAKLYGLPGVPAIAQRDFLSQLLQRNVANNSILESELTSLITALLPEQIHRQDSPLGNDWLTVLNQQFPKGWDLIQGRAIGRCASDNFDILKLLHQHFLESEPAQFRQIFIALHEAIHYGAGDRLIDLWIQVDFTTVSFSHFNSLAKFLRSASTGLTTTSQERLAHWLSEYAQNYCTIVYPALEAIADSSPTAQNFIHSLFAQLPEDQQCFYAVRLLRFQPIAAHPPLAELDKKSQIWLVQYYRSQARHSPAALNLLLQAMTSVSKDVAIAAAQDLSELNEVLTASQLIPLLRSRFPGIRTNVLAAFQVRDGVEPGLETQILTAICQALNQENNQAPARLLCELVRSWVRRRRSVAIGMDQALGGMSDRLMALGTFDGGLAKVLIAALKAIAQMEAPQTDSIILIGETRSVLVGINLVQVENGESEMIDLLCAINRLEHSFLATIVQQLIPNLVAQGWFRNVSAILKTVQRVEGQNSPLLDDVLARESCVKVQDIILGLRGV